MTSCGTGKLDDGGDCVTIVRDMKTVSVPCTRNIYQRYTVKVPRQVTEQVPRTVTYTEYETREKRVPYTVNKPERRVRMETQKYQVPVTRYYRKTVMETRERQVPVPYDVAIPETTYRTVTEKVPVQRSTTHMEEVVKTVYETQTRVRCVPETKMVTKEIPVYNVVARNAAPCPPVDDNKVSDYRTSFDRADTNKDNVISFEEYTAARAKNNLSEIVNKEPKYLD